MEKFLEPFILRMASAICLDDAFKAFCDAMGQYGYDKVAYTLCTDHPSLNLSKQHGLATSYPEDWMSHYRSNCYFTVDPVITKLLHRTPPFFWNDVVAEQSPQSISFRMMMEASDARLKDGIGISLPGSRGEIVGIGLARSNAESGKDYEFLAAAHLLASFFHHKFRELHEKILHIPSFTPKEIEVLHWAAEGKCDEDLATLLNVRRTTIRFHWANIFEKFGACSRVHAIIKAYFYGIIEPRHFSCPKVQLRNR